MIIIQKTQVNEYRMRPNLKYIERRTNSHAGTLIRVPNLEENFIFILGFHL